MYLRYRSQLEIEPRKLALRVRLLVYFSLWILAAIAFALTTAIGTAADTGHGEWVNRALVFLYSPVLASMGLASAFTWPNAAPNSLVLAAASYFVVHGVMALTRTRIVSFVILSLLHVAALAASIISMAHLSHALVSALP